MGSRSRRAAVVALVIGLSVLWMPRTPAALVKGDQIYVGVYNYTPQDLFFWIVYAVRMPDGRVIADKARHVLAHRIRKLVGVRVRVGKLASCEGGIVTVRKDKTGRQWQTRHKADLCKLHRVLMRGGQGGQHETLLDYNFNRDKNAYRDPYYR